MRAAIAVALVLGGLGVCAPAMGETLRFRALLTAPDGARPQPLHGSGVADLVLDTESKLLSWRVTYGGLSGPVTGARLKTPPEPGTPHGGARDLPPPLTSPIVSSVRLDDIEIGDLRAGLWSIALLTARCPQGEIGGDVEQAP